MTTKEKISVLKATDNFKNAVAEAADTLLKTIEEETRAAYKRLYDDETGNLEDAGLREFVRNIGKLTYVDEIGHGTWFEALLDQMGILAL